MLAAYSLGRASFFLPCLLEAGSPFAWHKFLLIWPQAVAYDPSWISLITALVHAAKCPCMPSRFFDQLLFSVPLNNAHGFVCNCPSSSSPVDSESLHLQHRFLIPSLDLETPIRGTGLVPRTSPSIFRDWCYQAPPTYRSHQPQQLKVCLGGPLGPSENIAGPQHSSCSKRAISMCTSIR